MKHLQNIRAYQVNEDQPVFLRMNQYTRQVFLGTRIEIILFLLFQIYITKQTFSTFMSV